jgi:hypothetical protein
VGRGIFVGVFVGVNVSVHVGVLDGVSVLFIVGVAVVPHDTNNKIMNI